MEKTISKQQLMKRSLFIAGGLTVLKLLVYQITNSLAILASAADSFMDLLISVVNTVFVFSASKPADKDHPYGHGKIESLAGLLQSLIMAGVAFGICGAAVKRFLHPASIELPMAGIGVSLVGLLLSLWHVRNLRVSMLRTGSQLMATEYLHYATDILAYIGVMLSLLLFKWTGSVIWDLLISILIVAYLLKTVMGIFNGALAELLDKQLPDPLLKEIDQTIRGYHPKIVDFHDLRTRKVGETKFIEFHVVLKDVHEFEEAHNITEGLIAELRKKYPYSIVTAHTDPEGAQ